MKINAGLALLAVLGALAAACSPNRIPPAPASIQREQLPTVIALTVEAIGQGGSISPAATLQPFFASETPSWQIELQETALPDVPLTQEAAQLTPEMTVLDAAENQAGSSSLTASGAQPGTPTRLPTATRTPTPTPAMPIANIQIGRPGPASRVVSPLRVTASLIPGAKGNVKMELFGEDGRLLVRKILSYSALPGARVNAISSLDFEIPGVAEAGRLVISTEDPQSRVIALASVDLVLLSLGEEDVNPPGNSFEPVVIREPQKNVLIQGGAVLVRGLALPRGKDPLLVQMLDKDGKQLGAARLLEIPASDDGQHTPFSVEMLYSVTTPTWVRLTISERDYRTPTATHISSVEIMLSP